ITNCCDGLTLRSSGAAKSICAAKIDNKQAALRLVLIISSPAYFRATWPGEKELPGKFLATPAAQKKRNSRRFPVCNSTSETEKDLMNARLLLPVTCLVAVILSSSPGRAATGGGGTHMAASAPMRTGPAVTHTAPVTTTTSFDHHRSRVVIFDTFGYPFFPY